MLLIPVIKVSALEEKNVKDFMNYLKDDEVKELQTIIEAINKDYKLDVVVVITKDTQGKSSRDFADDYYDNNGFGVGVDYSGLLLLINIDKREIWISTTGRAIDIFTDARITDITKAITSELSNGKYNEACKTFVNEVRKYAELGVPQGQHRVEVNTGERVSYFQRVIQIIKFLPVYLGAFIISIIATIIASLSSKGKVTINNRTYEDGTFVLADSRDDFVREYVTKTKIETSSNNKSSTHSGSSGRSHGGGGGSF